MSDPIETPAQSAAPAVARARFPSGMPRLSMRPGLYLASKLMGRPKVDVAEKAVERWEVDPAGHVVVRPAKMLPGQLDRIRKCEFGSIDEVVRDFTGGFESVQKPTMAYRLKNAVLLDGIVYADDGARHLWSRASRFPMKVVPQRIARASLYETWLGNNWFGNWLIDDCLAYQVAESVAPPVATILRAGHQEDYEQRLGMRPTRLTAAAFDELIVFNDNSHNPGKRQRGNTMRQRLIGGEEPARTPGVFLLRGTSGNRRILRNEMAIAEHLAKTRGFAILDPVHSPIDDIIRDCAGAAVVAGIEGSHLCHGLMMMPRDACLMVIQPPTRAESVLKMTTDRQGQDFAMVVGEGNDQLVDVDIGEIERTLDLV